MATNRFHENIDGLEAAPVFLVFMLLFGILLTFFTAIFDQVVTNQKRIKSRRLWSQLPSSKQAHVSSAEFENLVSKSTEGFDKIDRFFERARITLGVVSTLIPVMTILIILFLAVDQHFSG